MEGLESLVATMTGVETEDKRNYAVDPQGRKYLSARAVHHSRSP